MENGNNVPMTFENESLKMGIKVAMFGDQIYVVGSHLATTLGYSDTECAIKDHVNEKCKVTVNNLKQKLLNPIPGELPGLIAPDDFSRNLELLGLNSKSISVGRTQLINEAGIYQLIMKSKLPSAIDFQMWVCSDVLPAIRKHGMYLVGQEHKSDEEISLLKSELEKANQRLEILSSPRYLPLAFLEQLYGTDFYVHTRQNKCFIAAELFRFLKYIGLACNQHQNKGKMLTFRGRDVLKDCVTEVGGGTYSGTLHYGMNILDVVPEMREYIHVVMFGSKREILDQFEKIADIRRKYQQ
jgi:prophage antirepressor-like protein